MSVIGAVTRESRVVNRSCCTGEAEAQIRNSLAALGGQLIAIPTTRAQQDLEASLLLAISVALRRTDQHEHPTRLGNLLSSVAPASPLRMSMPREAAVNFLQQCLPVVADGQILGIAGLRPMPARDHVDLKTIGPDGATKAQVRLMVARRGDLSNSQSSVWMTHRTSLHDLEEAAINSIRPRPTGLMSAIFRRLMLWRSVTAFAIMPTNADTIHLQWREGPTAIDVATILTASSCGTKATAGRTHSSNRYEELLISQVDQAPQYPHEPHDAWLAVRRSFQDASDTGGGNIAGAYRRRTSAFFPENWEEPDMRDALSTRDISAVYRLLRKQGISQRQIAASTGQSQSEVSEILKGRQVMAYDVLARIADGLSIPRGYMGLAYDKATAVRILNTHEDPGQEEDGLVKRRRFRAHAAAVSVGAATMGRDRSGRRPIRKKASEPMKHFRHARRGAQALQIGLASGNGRTSVFHFVADCDLVLFRNRTYGSLGIIREETGKCPQCSPDGSALSVVFRETGTPESTPYRLNSRRERDGSRFLASEVTLDHEGQALRLRGDRRLLRGLWLPAERNSAQLCREHDEQCRLPTVAMSMVAGEPVPDLAEPSNAIRAVVGVLGQLRTLPLDPFTDLPRVDTATSYMNRITEVWPSQLDEYASESMTADMRGLLDAWHRHNDAAVLNEPAPRTFSRGDSNLLNWPWADPDVGVVDWEFTGYSDTAWDAAEFIEHLSAHVIDDECGSHFWPSSA